MVSPGPTSARPSFHGQDESELYHFSFRQHWIRLAWPTVKVLAQSLAILAFGWFVLFYEGVADAGSRHGILVALTLLLLVTHWLYLIRFFTYFLYIIVVTDRRVHRMKKTLFSVDDHQTVDIWTLQDINKSQHGFLQNLLGYGTILLESQDTELKLHFIPHINETYRKIAHVREVARERFLPAEMRHANTENP